MESQTDGGDPTQQAPEEILKQIEHAALECRVQMDAGLAQLKSVLDHFETLHGLMQRNNRRMELLRQMLRPAPPIDPKTDDDRLCKGERVIVSFLKTVDFVSPLELVKALNYAPSSLRTWLPMLRDKSIIAIHPQTGAIELCPMRVIPPQYHKQIESIQPNPKPLN